MPIAGIRPLAESKAEFELSEVSRAILVTGSVRQAAISLRVVRTTIYRILKRANMPLNTRVLLMELRRQQLLKFPTKLQSRNIL